MRIFLAGATGVIGVRLVPLLVSDGQEVAGMTRSTQKVEALRELRAEPVVCGVFDASAPTSIGTPSPSPRRAAPSLERLARWTASS